MCVDQNYTLKRILLKYLNEIKSCSKFEVILTESFLKIFQINKHFISFIKVFKSKESKV